MGSSEDSWQEVIENLKDYERIKKELAQFTASCIECSEAGAGLDYCALIDRLLDIRNG